MYNIFPCIWIILLLLWKWRRNLKKNVFVRGIVFSFKCQNRLIRFLEKIWISFFDGITNGSEERGKRMFYLEMGKVPLHLILKNYYLLNSSYCKAVIGSLQICAELFPLYHKFVVGIFFSFEKFIPDILEEYRKITNLSMFNFEKSLFPWIIVILTFWSRSMKCNSSGSLNGHVILCQECSFFYSCELIIYFNPYFQMFIRVSQIFCRPTSYKSCSHRRHNTGIFISSVSQSNGS